MSDKANDVKVSDLEEISARLTVLEKKVHGIIEMLNNQKNMLEKN